jgi:tetratricopeptide (TPR) repeat protein
MLALPYYQDFATRGSDDPALRIALANAYLNWGAISGDIGSKDGSKEILRTAINHFEGLGRADPTNLDVQIGLARSYQTLAQQSLNGEQGGEGFDEALRAAGTWAKVAKARPGDPEARRMLGRCYDLAAILCSGRDSDESRRLFQKAVKALRQAVADFPAHAETRRNLAKACNNIGVSYRMEGDSVGAERALGESLAISRELRDAQPNSMSIQTDLARTLLVRGQARLQIDASLLAAGDDLEEGRLVIESVIQKNPDVSDNHFILSNTYACLGDIRAEQGQTASARGLLGKAIAEGRELQKVDSSMFQIVPILIESESFLAAVERELGLVDTAKKTLGGALSEISERFQTVRDADYWRAYFYALLESTVLSGDLGSDRAPAIRPLREGLREREAELRKRPMDSIVRCQCVSAYLVIAQRFATSRANEDALQALEKADDLLRAGLELTPNHHRLGSQKAALETARGTALNRCGNIRGASAAADQAVAVAQKLAAEDPSYLYDLARALALKAGLSAPAPEPAVAAVLALRKAVDFGFDNVYKLKNDEYLQPIRGREDFQGLVRDVEKKAVGARSHSMQRGPGAF